MVILLLAVILAGIAVVSSVGDDLEGDAESETRYATVELGPQPGYVLERLEVGDVATVNDDTGTLTVTEVYIVPSATDSPMNVTAATDEQPANETDQAETALAAEPAAMGRRPEYQSRRRRRTRGRS
ncbi:hypothetical protein D8Y22_17320 [Salinadaptatus halalkaliphilus]|uniref:Uncharacterized protein n=1 Tax=Salinadaptatus halalkaliphilus TaxID=2419781 RepID=A0A4S3TJ78_9EURY|nr:hypothetical protein [Salinadaptatus halalkaliphilus]THE63580.1 hypothetical protein D8Y22_17320 [Salinadaptatus halalkaliphilus]